MKQRLSFGYISILADNIVEITVDEGVEISLEMIEESQRFLDSQLSNSFSMLINQVNDYTYSYEAQLSVASHENLVAVAFVYFSDFSKRVSETLNARRVHDNLNTKMFSGLELGWQEAITWLTDEMNIAAKSVCSYDL